MISRASSTKRTCLKTLLKMINLKKISKLTTKIKTLMTVSSKSRKRQSSSKSRQG
jgi:hypothetical protein